MKLSDYLSYELGNIQEVPANVQAKATSWAAQLEADNERLMKGVNQINWRAKTESLDRHLRDVVIEISDALKESE